MGAKAELDNAVLALGLFHSEYGYETCDPFEVYMQDKISKLEARMKAEMKADQYTVEQLRDARALLCYLYSQVGDQSAQLMDCAIDAIDAFLAHKEVE